MVFNESVMRSDIPSVECTWSKPCFPKESTSRIWFFLVFFLTVLNFSKNLDYFRSISVACCTARCHDYTVFSLAFTIYTLKPGTTTEGKFKKYSNFFPTPCSSIP